MTFQLFIERRLSIRKDSAKRRIRFRPRGADRTNLVWCIHISGGGKGKEVYTMIDKRSSCEKEVDGDGDEDGREEGCKK